MYIFWPCGFWKQVKPDEPSLRFLIKYNMVLGGRKATVLMETKKNLEWNIHEHESPIAFDSYQSAIFSPSKGSQVKENHIKTKK